MNGGAMVLPVLRNHPRQHEYTAPRSTPRCQQALITRDRMRVDVMAEFYVRVKPSAESIATAAQNVVWKPCPLDELKDLVEIR